jgi:pimeloyl-ACP methyl ester carboxylesterase
MTAMVNWYRAAIRARSPLPPNPRISTPTLVIWGAKDKFIIREAAQMSLEYCDNVRLEYIEDATHWVQHEEPQRVNQLLGEFLTG